MSGVYRARGNYDTIYYTRTSKLRAYECPTNFSLPRRAKIKFAFSSNYIEHKLQSADGNQFSTLAATSRLALRVILATQVIGMENCPGKFIHRRAKHRWRPILAANLTTQQPDLFNMVTAESWWGLIGRGYNNQQVAYHRTFMIILLQQQ